MPHTRTHTNTQVPHSVFCTAAVDVPAAMSLGNLTTYNEVVNRLNRLFEDQTRDMEELTDVSNFCLCLTCTHEVIKD